jgi:outer membrane lipoprotein-sorting protein
MNEQTADRPESELPDDILQQAIESIEKEAVPAGPPPELVSATLRALEGFAQPEQRPLPFVPRTRFMKFAAIAASLLLLTSLLARFVPTVESPHAFGEEFGRALKQVREAGLMSYVQEMTIEGQKKPIISKDFIAEDGRRRTEMVGNVTTIFDTTGNIRITLLGKTHTALVGEAKENHGFNPGKMFLDWLQQLKELGDKPDKELGQRELDGKRVTGFVVTQPGRGAFTMWISGATSEPVRIEYDLQVNGAPAHITMKDFHFDQKLDESLFSFDVPAGYEIFGRPKDGKFESPAGFELAWSKNDSWFGVAGTIGRPTIFGLKYQGRVAELNAGGKEIAEFKVGEQAGSIRAAKLLAGQACQLLAFGVWVGPTVEARSSEGDLLWAYPSEKTSGDPWAVDDVRAADLDGDGLDEVIIGYNGGTGLHVLDCKGQLLWKKTNRANIWRVAAGDVDGDGKPEVLSTSVDGKVQVFNAQGDHLRDIDPDFHAHTVLTWRESADKPALILVASFGKGKATLALLDFNEKTRWSLELSAAVADAAICAERPWLALSLQDGTVRIVDLVAGKEIAHLGGQGVNAGVAWLPVEGRVPLLVIETMGKQLQAFRINAEQPK